MTQRRTERQQGARSSGLRRGPASTLARRGRRLAGVLITAMMLALPLTIAAPAVSSATAADLPKIK
ncbi:MAG: hypothetical protein ACR2P2_20770, partial [Nakamurella sp.]